MSDSAPTAFVPDGFVPPSPPRSPAFRLVPLGPEHNESDHAAWSSSIDHIRATPGFERWTWPRPMSLEDNHRDLVRHAGDFAAGRGFTYTVLAPDDDTVIGCLYIYPSKDPAFDADVHSWVRAADAPLDRVLHDVVAGWLAREWPFSRVDYAARAPEGRWAARS